MTMHAHSNFGMTSTPCTQVIRYPFAWHHSCLFIIILYHAWFPSEYSQTCHISGILCTAIMFSHGLSHLLHWKGSTEKKREPKWLSWRVILKIGSLLWGRATFFFIIMFTKASFFHSQNSSLLTRRAKSDLFFALKQLSYKKWHQNGAS